jgi:hypothetical protein
MVLYLCVLIVFSLHQESLKLILATNPFPRWFCHSLIIATFTHKCVNNLLLYCHVQVLVSNGWNRSNRRLNYNLLLTPLQLHNAQIIPGANITISLYFILILAMSLITYCIDIVSTIFWMYVLPVPIYSPLLCSTKATSYQAEMMHYLLFHPMTTLSGCWLRLLWLSVM